MPDFLKKILSISSYKNLSTTAQKLLDQEERRSAVIWNRFRYFFGILLILPVFTNALSSFRDEMYVGVMINFAAFVCFMAVTVIHTIILKKGSMKSVNFFGYLTILFDYINITMVTYAWTLSLSGDNMAMFLKNPTLFYYIIPISASIFQFRARFVVFSITLYLLLHYISVFIAVKSGIPVTSDWKNYVLGEGVIMADILTTRPAVIICLGLSIGYAIFRVFIMMKRIAHVESQKASLARYFSPAIVDEITSSPDLLKAGSNHKVSVLFMDIRNFTSMSEKMQPDEISSFLSDFRRILTRAVFDSGGTIDKYIGDAIMAVFGTPKPSPITGEDSRNAVIAGLEMLKRLDDFNSERSMLGHQTVHVGIGIHTGEVFAGNVGFEDRMEYTVIGDVVNTASRIEGLCKTYKAEFIISEEVYSEVKDLIEAEKLPPAEVKGKEKPLEIYRVIKTADPSYPIRESAINT